MPIDRIAICCPGPSLAGLDRTRLDGAFVVAVNAACELVEADAWCAIDKEAFVRFTPLGDPVRVGIATMRQQLLRSAPDRADEWNAARWATFAYCEWPTPKHPTPTHYDYTGLAAMVYGVSVARLHGLGEVEVYGCDLDGFDDCLGEARVDPDLQRARGDDRWEREARGIRHAMKVAASGMPPVALRFDPLPARLRQPEEVAA